MILSRLYLKFWRNDLHTGAIMVAGETEVKSGQNSEF
jgi:hypothetical protein